MLVALFGRAGRLCRVPMTGNLWINYYSRERGHMAFSCRKPGALWEAGAPIAQTTARRRARQAYGHVDNERALPTCQRHNSSNNG